MPRKNRPPPIQMTHYSYADGVLRIGFADGTAYSYSDVPLEVYLEFEIASSKGSYFNANIRNVYG